MFIKLPTTKKEYAVNLDKVLFFYSYKDNVTRFELDDGSLIDANVNFEDVLYCLYGAGITLPYGFPPEKNQM